MSKQILGWGTAEDLHLLLGQYVRAQVLPALVTFLVWATVFLAAGVLDALVLAAIEGVPEFIPVIGPLTAGLPATGVSLFGGYGHPWRAGVTGMALSIPVIAAARIVWRRLPTPTALSIDDRVLDRSVASPRQR